MKQTPDAQQTPKKKNYKVGRIVLRFLVFLFISLIIGTSFYKWNAKTLTGDQLPTPFGFATAVVLSGSMEPTLSIDDLIVVQKCDSYNIKDIVVYQENKSCVVHRIIDVDEDGTFITRGDANNAPDDPIHISQIKGKVLFHIPGVGKALEFVKSPIVIIILVILAIILLAKSYKKEKASDLDELDSIKLEIERLKAEKEKFENGEAEKSYTGDDAPVDYKDKIDENSEEEK